MSIPHESVKQDNPVNCYETKHDVMKRYDCALTVAQFSKENNVRVPAFYYNRFLKKCIIMRFMHEALELGAKDGWEKYATNK